MGEEINIQKDLNQLIESGLNSDENFEFIDQALSELREADNKFAYYNFLIQEYLPLRIGQEGARFLDNYFKIPNLIEEEELKIDSYNHVKIKKLELKHSDYVSALLLSIDHPHRFVSFHTTFNHDIDSYNLILSRADRQEFELNFNSEDRINFLVNLLLSWRNEAEENGTNIPVDILRSLQDTINKLLEDKRA